MCGRDRALIASVKVEAYPASPIAEWRLYELPCSVRLAFDAGFCPAILSGSGILKPTNKGVGGMVFRC